MDEHVNTRTRHTSGLNTWRAGCGGSRTSGSEGGPEKPTRRKPDRALRSDPYTYPSQRTMQESPAVVIARLTGDTS